MTTVFSGTSANTATINSTTPYFLTANGVINPPINTAVRFTAGSNPGEAIIAGTISATQRGIWADGNDHIDITQTGVVLATDASDAIALLLQGSGNSVRIAGSVTSDSNAIFASGAGQEVVVTETGVVRGGASSHSDSSGVAYSVAIAFMESASTLVNNGDIIAEVNAVTGARIAVSNAGQSNASENLLNPLSDYDLTFFNTGFVHGDVYFSAGEDTYDARGGGIVNGTIDMGRHSDIFRGGEGDELAFGGLGADTMSGGSGMDTLIGQGGSDSLSGGGNGDTLRGQDGLDELFGGSGGDFMVGGHGHDAMRGDSGNDDMRGGTGNDQMFGGSGRDTMIGGTGDDTLRGDSQFDTYVFNNGFGQDLIVGFHGNNAEKIDLSGVRRIQNFNDLVNNHLSQQGPNAEIDAGNGNVITIAGFNSNNLDAADFIF